MSAPEQFDASKFAAEVIQKNLSSIMVAAKDFTKGTAALIERKLKDSYKTYILNSAQHYGTAHTFFIRNERVPIYNYYVPLDIATGKSQLTGATVSGILKRGNKALIAGKAGCGKSTLMRHFFLDSIRETKIPIFVELNQLNDSDSPDLWTIVHDSVAKHGLKLDLSQLRASIGDGGFALLFDGLDEVQESLRKSTMEQVERISALSSGNLCIVSSRPDDSIAQLKSFRIFDILPLSLQKAVDLVDLAAFDQEIKKKFSAALKSNLYERHKTFLANPLLLSIMLLTYGQSASIPNKISIFFNQAFEALFQTHDAYKGGFARKRATSLDIQEFERAFAAFCLLSYDLSSMTFTRTECLEFMTKAKELTQLDYTSAEFLKDCLQAVCLLMQDGLKIAFVHRSFQEYFAAKCIMRFEDPAKAALLKRFGARSRVDNVLERYLELDQKSFEKLWLIPVVNKLRERIGVKRKVTTGNYLKYLRVLFYQIRLEPGNGRENAKVEIVHNPGPEPVDDIRNLVFLVFSRYWSKSREAKGIDLPALNKSVIKESMTVNPESLRVQSPELKTIGSIGWVVGLEFIQFVVDLPDTINRQRQVEVESIESILRIHDKR